LSGFEIDADIDSRPYFDGLAAGEVLLQRCAACERHQFPPRAFCTVCGRRDLPFVEASGRGRIYAMSVMHRASEESFAGVTPYAVALVDLDEGVRVMARGSVPPAELMTGMDVLVSPEPEPLVHPTLVFRPAEERP